MRKSFKQVKDDILIRSAYKELNNIKIILFRS